MNIYVRDIHNYMIKPSENGGLASVVDYINQKVPISNTRLRSFITPKVCKMTPKLCHICGCELCIIPKDMQTNLDRFRTRLVIDLQHKSSRRHKKIVYLVLQVLHKILG